MTTLPYKIATLLYCFNDCDEVLLIERARGPNLGCWSPFGGKLFTEVGESPCQCACREAKEETGFEISPAELHLTGIISEHGYQGQAHWLMFLFEITPRFNVVPAPVREGRFQFHNRESLVGLKLPETDRERIWPLFWKHRGGFFAAHCRCSEGGLNDWTLEQSVLR